MKRTVLALALVVAGCVQPQPPIVVPQPPLPVALSVHAVVRDDAGRTPEHIRGVIGTADWTSVCVPLSFAMLSCDLPVGMPYGGTVSVRFEGDGSDPLVAEMVTAPDWNIVLPPSVHPLSPLAPRGRFWFTADGQPFIGPMATSFNLFARYLLEGPAAIEPVLAQYEREHYPLIRVFTAFDICPVVGPGCAQPIGRLIPREHPEFYASIPAFLTATAKHGVYVQFVAFTGPYGSVFNSNAEKIAHWEALKSAVPPEGNGHVEEVNEGNHEANSDIPFAQLSRPPPSLLAAHGSGTQDADPVEPTWGFVTWHPGGNEWQRKPGHGGWEVSLKYSVAVMVNEMVRAPDQDANPDHFYDAGASCTLFGVLCTLHSVHGKAGQLWDAQELTAARALRRGIDSIPVYCRTGAYVHPDDGAFLRVYEMAGVGPGCRVEIRP